MNYEKDMKIDITALDVECLRQAELALKYGKHWKECKDRFNRAEEKIKVVRAELISTAHSNPVKCLKIAESVKPTAPMVESFYRNHKKHKEAKEEWLNAMEAFNYSEVAKREISVTRKSMLENLITLHGQMYFAGPSVPHTLKSVQKALEERSDSKIGKKLNKKRDKK